MNIRLFELLEPLLAGRSAQACLLKWDGTKYVPTAEKVTVYDYVGSHGTEGDRGYTFFSPQSTHWEVLSGLFTQEYESIV